jgi:hypothetical protein
MIPPITDPRIQAAFDAFPKPALEGALVLRKLIFETAALLPNVPIPTDCLRWRQPSYVTPIGSALRIGIPKSGNFALFAHCQSTIVSQFERAFNGDFRIDGNRAVLFEAIEDIQPDKLKLLIEHAITYKR